MKNKLNIQKFIEENENWETLLQDKPYCLRISRDYFDNRNLIMFKYNQIESDFNNEIVRECRGIILDEDTFEVVSHAFDKFGNYGESYCPEIDWKSCYVTEKIDGSLVKIVKTSNGGLLISTNGTISAFKAPIAEQIGCEVESFGDLVLEAVKNQHAQTADCSDYIEWFKNLFKDGYTYMFELTSPFNKVVVSFSETRLNFIGCRDNETGGEIFFGDHPLAKVFNTPKVFPLRSVAECIEAASKLDCHAEGYVVVDRNFNRVKIKSQLYVQLHHLRGEGPLTYERALGIIRNNELDEVLTYFPEFKPVFDKLAADLFKLSEQLNASWIEFQNLEHEHLFSDDSRKARALWIQKTYVVPGCGFALMDGKVKSVQDWVDMQPAKNLLKWMGYN